MRRALCPGISLTGLSIVLIAGCGGSTGPGGRLAISGTVYYKGSPIQSGTIEFVPHKDVKTSGGGMITNGRFSIPADRGLEPGDYTIKISAIETPAISDEPGGLPGQETATKDRIPAKYNEKSILTERVEPGKTSFAFKLD
ncbi:MAG: hypothetical protein L0215_21515 [Gemmataceae bacterium]|nr:hypothetical protein [Gemmataceae bacterium]